MKKIFLLITFFATQQLFGFYAGIGMGWNSIDESYKSTLFTNEDRSGNDRYDAHLNRFVPVITVGHQFCFSNDWILGISAEWKYLNYYTPNENSSRGQILPNATFSSINFFGPEVIRDFTSVTRVYNEGLLLAKVGKEIGYGFAYLGGGAALFDASNSIYVSSIHTPNGVGDHLTSGSVRDREVIWGGAIQAGYQFFLNANSFVNIGYTYIDTGRYQFKNSVNAAVLNGFEMPGSTTLFLHRSVRLTVQELVLSMNLRY